MRPMRAEDIYAEARMKNATALFELQVPADTDFHSY